MARYYEQVAEGGDVERVIVRAFERVWLPLAISAFTTMVGFGSLMVNRITAIWDLGLFAVVGIACLTITCLTFLPAALALFPVELRSERSGKVSPVARRQPRPPRRLGLRVPPPDPLGSRSSSRSLAARRRAAHPRRRRLPLLLQPRLRGAARERDHQPRDRRAANIFYVVLEGGSRGVLKRWEVLKLDEGPPGASSRRSRASPRRCRSSTTWSCSTPGLKQGRRGHRVLDEQGNLVPADGAEELLGGARNLEPLLESRRQESGDLQERRHARLLATASILVRTNLSGSRDIEETLAKVRDYVAQALPRRDPRRGSPARSCS